MNEATESLISQAEVLEEKIDGLEKEKNIKQGEIKSARKRLKDEFGLGSVKDAKKEEQRLQHELKALDEELHDVLIELDELIGDINLNE